MHVYVAGAAGVGGGGGGSHLWWVDVTAMRVRVDDIYLPQSETGLDTTANHSTVLLHE